MHEMPTECPKCAQPNVYPDGVSYICADCGYEWPIEAAEAKAESSGDEERVVRDANGTKLSPGDTVVVIKDLPLKGSSTTLKQGTKITNIRLVDGDHEVDCRANGMSVMLKAQYLRKA